jgi:hypothetical protein
MKGFCRELGWDSIVVIATIAIGYGIDEMVVTYRGLFGLVLAVLTAMFPVIVVDVLYPL